MAAGARDQFKGYQLLYDALMSQARDAGFALTPETANMLVEKAIENINAASIDDEARRTHVRLAIAALPKLVDSVSAATQVRTFNYVASVHDVMRSKTCNCPFPWGY
jgi:hypothetical protein